MTTPGQLEALLAAATPGETWIAPRPTSILSCGIVATPTGRMVGSITDPKDAALIVTLVNAAPEIIAMMRREEALVARVAELEAALATIYVLTLSSHACEETDSITQVVRAALGSKP